MSVLGRLIDRFPGLGSYRGRYLLLASLMTAVLLSSGLIGYRYVTTVSAHQLTLIQQRAAATALTHDSLRQLQDLKQQIYQRLINPPPIDSAQVALSATHLRNAVERLATTRWLEEHQDLSQLSRQINEDALKLQMHVHQLNVLRAERSNWFPALGAIEQYMLPANTAANALLDIILEEAKESHHTASGWRNHLALIELQYSWLHATSELRLLIANRFGIFANEPMEGILGRASNIRAFISECRANLDFLATQRSKGLLDFIASNELDELRHHIDTWNTHFEHALKQVSGEEWRADILYLQTAITPLLDNTQQRLSGILLELDVQSARNITDMTDLSTNLSSFTLMLALLGTLFLITTYFMFSRLVLHPIQQTARALNQEAKGEEVDAQIATRVRETEDLISAFEEMRQQVRSRQNHLDHLAHHDSLTNLPNRLLFRDRLEHAVTLARRGKSQLAVLFLDLDRFKQINDSLGHATGDEMLQITAQRLTQLMRESDTVARLGGDEFAILTEGISRREEVTRLAERVIQALEEPFIIDGRPLHISTSIGITLCPNDDIHPEGLLQGADAAMYEAKRAGKGRFRFYTAEMTEQATEYLNLETHLRAAVLARDFNLHFQPVTDSHHQRLLGCEALLRWEHPEEGPVSPEVFIPILDDMGQMGVVSEWILNRIHQQLQHFDAAGHGHLNMAMNLTARLLHDDTFADHLLQALNEHRPDPARLIIEITEDTLTQDLQAAERVLRQLKQLGVRIALDDFGTGQSSLQHLRRFPFDIVKIDREFVRDIPHDPNDVDLVRAIIGLSHAFGMTVVAEGVETKDQSALLREMHCDHLQGYLISRPLPEHALAYFLDTYEQHHVISQNQNNDTRVTGGPEV